MADDVWTGRTATEIAAAVRGGEVTAERVVAAHLERIAELDGRVGAFVRVRAAAAAAEARAVDGRADLAGLPLAGVPVAVKDNVPVAGEPMRSGSAATPDAPQDRDHPVVARLRVAGAVVVGLTNLPELGIYPMSDSVYGVSRNPWDPRRTPGGSSGGSAAAVAAGLVPVAHGNDGAGSIRIPAADCGLVGLKPGLGVVPAELGSDDWGGMAENGPLATTAADAALMFSVLAGSPGDGAAEEPGPLRVALSLRAPAPGVRVHRDFAAAARAAAGLLAGAGHTVAAQDPPYPLWAANALTARWFAAPLNDAAALDAGRLEPRTVRHLRAGRAAARVAPARAGDRDRLREALAPFFAGHDVLLLPPLARYPPRALRWGERSWARSALLSIRYAPMTAAWNLAGYPAITVPFGPGPAGLPLSVQLVAPPGGEGRLLGLAALLERLHPWPRLAPAFA